MRASVLLLVLAFGGLVLHVFGTRAIKLRVDEPFSAENEDAFGVEPAHDLASITLFNIPRQPIVPRDRLDEFKKANGPALEQFFFQQRVIATDGFDGVPTLEAIGRRLEACQDKAVWHNGSNGTCLLAVGPVIVPTRDAASVSRARRVKNDLLLDFVVTGAEANVRAGVACFCVGYVPLQELPPGHYRAAVSWRIQDRAGASKGHEIKQFTAFDVTQY